ncbi:hypothetical protein AWC27_26525 [Mycobacterium szulgai]|uniref:Uncharacterized protein n=1 Tax=Mycobacterium szulgai TaxID=1787 RepID=A0A1X2EMG6_MYCSZ|nr:hypothetical protein AWC27_26525 [Mycobacterium szulgai]
MLRQAGLAGQPEKLPAVAALATGARWCPRCAVAAVPAETYEESGASTFAAAPTGIGGGGGSARAA